MREFLTIIVIEFVGGPYDGVYFNCNYPTETLVYKNEKYSDTFKINEKGFSVYRYSEQAGGLAEEFFEEKQNEKI